MTAAGGDPSRGARPARPLWRGEAHLPPAPSPALRGPSAAASSRSPGRRCRARGAGAEARSPAPPAGPVMGAEAGPGAGCPPFERVAAGRRRRSSCRRRAMGRAVGLAGLLLGLFLVPAVLVSTSLRHSAPRSEPESAPGPEPAEWEPASGAVPEDSLWPLPQRLRTSRRQLQLAPGRFQLVHGAGSSAGPACGLLQDAFRR